MNYKGLLRRVKSYKLALAPGSMYFPALRRHTYHDIFTLNYVVFQIVSRSAIQMFREASLGMRRSPLGETATEPTFGPSGRQERLNCCAKKRR